MSSDVMFPRTIEGGGFCSCVFGVDLDQSVCNCVYALSRRGGGEIDARRRGRDLRMSDLLRYFALVKCAEKVSSTSK